MRHTTVAILALLLSPGLACAQEWKATFVPDKGSRIDYLPKKGGFNGSADSTPYRFEFIVPITGDAAKIRLVPTGENTGPSQDYPAVVVHRGEDMITLVLVYTGTPQPDKFEVYTLYRRAGVGFSSIVSAYIGDRNMKALSATNPDIPVASASIIPLRQIGK